MKIIWFDKNNSQIKVVHYFLVQEKLREQEELIKDGSEARNLMNEDQNSSAPNDLQEINGEKPAVKQSAPFKNKACVAELRAREKLIEKENRNLELKIKLSQEQRMLLQAKESNPEPSAGRQRDENSNFVNDNESLDETQDGDVLECLDADGVQTIKTMSHSIEHEGYLNSREMLRGLEPHQQGVLSVIRLFFQNLAQLPQNLRSGGGQHWKKFVAEVEQNKTNIEDLIDFNNREGLKVLFKKVGDCMKELFKMCSPSSSIGTLLMFMQWMEQSSVKKLFGTNICKSVIFSFKILAKQNRQMFQSDVNTLSSWRAVQESRRGNRESGSSYSPYARRGNSGGYGNSRENFRSNYRGNFRGSFRGSRGGPSRGRGSYGGSRGSYARNTVKE